MGGAGAPALFPFPELSCSYPRPLHRRKNILCASCSDLPSSISKPSRSVTSVNLLASRRSPVSSLGTRQLFHGGDGAPQKFRKGRLMEITPGENPVIKNATKPHQLVSCFTKKSPDLAIENLKLGVLWIGQSQRENHIAPANDLPGVAPASVLRSDLLDLLTSRRAPAPSLEAQQHLHRLDDAPAKFRKGQPMEITPSENSIIKKATETHQLVSSSTKKSPDFPAENPRLGDLWNGRNHWLDTLSAVHNWHENHYTGASDLNVLIPNFDKFGFPIRDRFTDPRKHLR